MSGGMLVLSLEVWRWLWLGAPLGGHRGRRRRDAMWQLICRPADTSPTNSSQTFMLIVLTACCRKNLVMILHGHTCGRKPAFGQWKDWLLDWWWSVMVKFVHASCSFLCWHQIELPFYVKSVSSCAVWTDSAFFSSFCLTWNVSSYATTAYRLKSDNCKEYTVW